jgi:hypothetical protein
VPFWVLPRDSPIHVCCLLLVRAPRHHIRRWPERACSWQQGWSTCSLLPGHTEAEAFLCSPLCTRAP